MTRAGSTLASSIESPACSRDSSRISCTRADRRAASVWIRTANRRTVSGSSAACSTVSASRDIAPIGVLSSWEVFTTKSRRTSSTRLASVWSSASSSTSEVPSGATRSWTTRVPWPNRPLGSSSSASRVSPSAMTCSTSSWAGPAAIRSPLTSPNAWAPALARTTEPSRRSTTVADRRTASTSVAASSSSGGGGGTISCWSRSLNQNASMATTPTTTPTTPAARSSSPRLTRPAYGRGGPGRRVRERTDGRGRQDVHLRVGRRSPTPANVARRPEGNTCGTSSPPS